MIPVTKELYLYHTPAREHQIGGTSYMVFKDKTLCLTTHPEYEKAVDIATKEGWVLPNDRYSLTELGEALMKLMN